MSEALDSAWFRKLALASVEVLTHLKSDLESPREQRELFLSGAISCPSFKYAHIDDEALAVKQERLSLLRAEIKATENNEIVRELYLAKITEYEASIQLLKAAYGASVSGVHRDDMVAQFQTANHFLYGQPDGEIFMWTLARLKRKLRNVSERTKEQFPKSFDQLKRITAQAPDSLSPYHFVIDKNEHTDNSVIHDGAEVVFMFNEALKEYGLQDKWRVEIDETGLQFTFSAIGHRKVISIPGRTFFDTAHERGAVYTMARIRGIIAHEIGTHAVRRKNGLATPLLILGFGLDRFRKGDEGIATYRAQYENGSRVFAGFLTHLAIGLACGLEPDGSPKNFAQLHELLTSYFQVIGGYKEEKAKSKAWDVCWRMFRGTVCTEPGMVFTKDIFYREGNILVHQLLHAFPEAEQDFSIGNFDPTRRSHVDALCNLGLLPEDPWRQISKEFSR